MDRDTSQEHLDDRAGSGISRRTILKRVGAGVAIAWTAPIVRSVPAFAAGAAPGSPPPLCPVCAALTDCGPPDNPVSNICGHDDFFGWDCGCVTRHQDHVCTCWNGFGWCLPDGNLCLTDADCAPFGAAYQCLDLVANGCLVCGSATTFCGPPCNSGVAQPGHVPAGAVRMH